MTHETYDYVQILHDNGYRVTPQRLIILDAICDLGGHVDLAQITARVHYLDPTIDKSTIYRALEVLTTVGLVNETLLDKQGKVYTVVGANHHHLVCQSCGEMMTLPDHEFQQFQQHILTEYGFLIQADHMAFKGLCQSCRDTDR